MAIRPVGQGRGWTVRRGTALGASTCLRSGSASTSVGSRGPSTATAPALSAALTEMEALETGAIANPDEDRKVGHYWLRAPERAPTVEHGGGIRGRTRRWCEFADDVRAVARRRRRRAVPERRSRRHRRLGARPTAARATRSPTTERGCGMHFMDNADPDGIARICSRGSAPSSTARFVVGGEQVRRARPTPTNGLREIRAASAGCRVGCDRQAIAITQEGSALDRGAGGRGLAPPLAAVGLGRRPTPSRPRSGSCPRPCRGRRGGLPRGARRHGRRDPQARLAAQPGRAARAPVAPRRGGPRAPEHGGPSLRRPPAAHVPLPAAAGDGVDRQGADLGTAKVLQGLTVYGNKGSTDQHAYVQQLREGPADFFVTFIAALLDASAPRLDEATGATLGDFLFGYALSARDALCSRGRQTISLSVPPGRRARRGHPDRVVRACRRHLRRADRRQRLSPAQRRQGCRGRHRQSPEGSSVLPEGVRATRRSGDVADGLGRPDDAETVHAILARLALDPRRGVHRSRGAGDRFDDRFGTDGSG